MLIYRPPSSSIWSFLANLYFILESFILVILKVILPVDILVPSIRYHTLISRTYYKLPLFNIELVNLRKLLRKYESSKLESDLISFKVFYRCTRKNFSLPNCHTSLICSVIMEYILSKLINYLSQ